MPASHFPDDKTEAQCGCITELSGEDLGLIPLLSESVAMWTLKAEHSAVILVWFLSSWQCSGWREMFLSVPCT